MSRPAAPRGKLLFLVTEDWFVRSHFLPMVAQGVAEGFEVAVAARMGDARGAIEAAGARTIDLGLPRGDNGPAALARAVARVRGIFRAEAPDLVQAISLKPILLAILAAGAARRARFVHLVTGLGFLTVAGTARAQAARRTAGALIARQVRRGAAHLAVENLADKEMIEGGGAPFRPQQWTLLPGAGVDPGAYPALPQPPSPPVRIGIAARLVRSKGIDIAAAAIARARALAPELGLELAVAGAPDPDNPAAYRPDEIARWAADGAVMRGHVRDIPGFWAEAHIACLPTRGGEGLPRSLIEAAACGRPLITTRAPGCAEFVLEGETGLVTPIEDPDAMAAAFVRLGRDAPLRTRMGAAARTRVETGYTEAHVRAGISRAWAAALS